MRLQFAIALFVWCATLSGGSCRVSLHLNRRNLQHDTRHPCHAMNSKVAIGTGRYFTKSKIAGALRVTADGRLMIRPGINHCPGKCP